MIVLKTIGIIFLISVVIGSMVVKHYLNAGAHVPTNKEIIAGTKMYMEARKNPVKTTKRETVKASSIKRLN